MWMHEQSPAPAVKIRCGISDPRCAVPAWKPDAIQPKHAASVIGVIPVPEDTEDQPDSDRELIRAAADQHTVDLDHAIAATDNDPASDRIYIIEDTQVDGYRLISYGLDADDRPAAGKPISIPDTAVGGIQGLLHAAGMHVVEHLEGGTPISIRDLSEGMGISEPLKPRADEPRAVFEDEDEGEHDADSDEHQ